MANDKPGLHLPLDEIRVSGETAVAPNVGAVGGDAIVHGNPKIIHDPTMGTCMQFDGEDDYLELADPAAATFARGMTVAAWVRFEDVPSYGRIFDLNLAQNDKPKIIWAGNEGRTQTLAYEIDGVRFRVDDGVALRTWRHYAFVYESNGKVSILIDGVPAFSEEVAFDIANTAWEMGYIGKSSYPVNKLFHGAMAHFRLYNQALTAAEINDLMIKDRSAMAHYRETTLLKVDLYTIREDAHKPILYVEAENKGEPLEVSLTNPTDKAIAFKPFAAPTADDFHVQLRFRRNVIAPNVLKNLQKVGGITIDDWSHAAGTTADGREDYISFVKADENLALDKGAAWRIQIPDFSAAAQGGARNTRIQVRYRTEPQDPGSVVRHMEVQSHLGLKTIPLIARFRDSNTILNNGQTSNELTIEVVYIKDTGSVRLDGDSKFELIVDTDLLTSGSSVNAVPGVAWLEAQPAESGMGHETIPFHVKLSGGGEQSLLEVSREQKLTFELTNWVTDKPSGSYNILLRYENIPGYWDGAWVLPVQFTPLVLRSDKIGIGTDDPSADLEIRRDVQGAVGPVLRLNNFGGLKGAGAAIDFNGYDVGKKTVTGPDGKPTEEWHDPTFRIQSVDDGGHRSDLVFSGKKEARADSELEEKARITAEGRLGIGTDDPQTTLDVQGDAHIAGRIQDKTGFVMPVGAIIAYGGSTPPKGWLTCDGSRFNREAHPELYAALNKDTLPDLRSRFIVGSGNEYSLNSQGGEATVTLTKKHMPSHKHKVKDPGHSHIIKPEEKDGQGYMDDSGNGTSNRKKVSTESATTGITIKHSGDGKAHNNLPPYYALTYIIKY